MSGAEQFLERQVRRHETPSVQYVFFDRTDILFRSSKGWADLAGRVPIDKASRCHLFSITKTFTALAVMQLAENRRLDINKPVRDFFPGFPYGGEITIRQLLTHTAGIPNPIPLGWIHLPEEHPSFDQASFFRPIFLQHAKLKTGPGEKFAYSNLGYVLLGRLIEEITGSEYEDYVRRNIIDRLGLAPAEMGFGLDEDGVMAKGYQKRWSGANFLLGLFLKKARFMNPPEGRWRPFKAYYINGAPYGGLVGTVGGLARFGQELLKPDGGLISESGRKALFTENRTKDGKSTGMCLAWFTGILGTRRYFAHAGGGGGFYCEIRLYPEIGRGSVIAFNRTGMSDRRVLDRVDKFFLEP